MCGICGVIQLGGEPRPVIDRATLDRMTDLMTHRGPNDRGTYVADGVALGVRRLSIVDVDGGHQPFSNETGRIWAIQNGELYNHAELRRQLAADGHSFRSRCDTEVLPHLYERYGPSFQSHLRGKFGLAVWDGERRRAVLARDPLGVKPLYYAHCGDVVVFASELKSVIASGLVPLDLDYEAIDAYLALGYVPGPRTPLASVAKLMPGHRLVIDPQRASVEQYWRYPEHRRPSRRLSEEEYGEGLIEHLEDAVRVRLMSDVPVGAMLSGGLDSSLVVALMARNLAEPVKTFSVGFAEAGDANELGDARLMANAVGADHYELELSLTERAVKLDELAWHLDEPLADLSALGFMILSEVAAEHVTVALSGQGADELLGGYAKHQAASLCGTMKRVPAFLRAPGIRIASHGPPNVRRLAKVLAAPDPATRLFEMSRRLDDGLRRSLVRGPLAELDGKSALRAVQAHADGIVDDPLPATLYLDSQLALVDDMLLYFDRASMARSLEVRVPFLDTQVVEYCAGIPSEFKVRRFARKHVLKQAARGILPDRIIDKPKVGFFADSLDVWFRAQTDGEISEWLLGSNRRYSEFLDPVEVNRLAQGHLAGTGTENLRLLLSILMLEVWLDSYLPRALGAGARSNQPVRLSA